MLDSTKNELLTLSSSEHKGHKNFALELQSIHNNFLQNTHKMAYASNLQDFENKVIKEKIPANDKNLFLRLCREMKANI
jgi:hypothetical protein